MPKEFQESTYQIPTIIGLDFLKLSNLKLVVDFNNHKAFLESSDMDDSVD